MSGLGWGAGVVVLGWPVLGVLGCVGGGLVGGGVGVRGVVGLGFEVCVGGSVHEPNRVSRGDSSGLEGLDLLVGGCDEGGGGPRWLVFGGWFVGCGG